MLPPQLDAAMARTIASFQQACAVDSAWCEGYLRGVVEAVDAATFGDEPVVPLIAARLAEQYPC